QYDAQGKQLCCTQEEKIYTNAGAKELIDGQLKKEEHSDDHSQDDGHDHANKDTKDSVFKMFQPAVFSLALLFAGIVMDNWLLQTWFKDWVRIIWYVIAYIPVGMPVLKEAMKSISKGEIFSEFLLMGIATIGAFAIGEYP